MTSLSLLFWIVLGIALQLAIYLGIVFWRRWLEYRALHGGGRDLAPPAAAPRLAAQDPGEAWPGFRTFRVDRKVAEDAAQSVCSFYLAPEDGRLLPPFLPGQFLTFRLDLPSATGGVERVVRCYSLSDSPNAGNYRISIKRVPPAVGSAVQRGRASGYFHDQVAVGTLLQVRAPAGRFYLDHSDAPVVLIAGGIGITPMLSMLNWCVTEQPGREVWLFYGVRDGRALVMKSHLESLAAAHPSFHLRVYFSDPQAEDVLGRDHQHRGRVDVALLRMELPLRPYHFYICGPSPMMQSLVSGLEDWGVPEARIHFEAFGPSSLQRRQDSSRSAARPPSEAGDPSILVDFAQSQKQLPWQPAARSLLEFAESHGISADFGCRAGSCGTCQTRIRSGEVSYLQPPDYEPEPGTCLLCVCAPKTSLTLEA